MTDSKRNPKIDKWLDEVSTGEQAETKALVLKSTNQLSGLLMASDLQVAPFPEEVLIQWAREIVRARRVVNQSEPAFIKEALKCGWPWERIRDRLGLPSTEAAQRRQDELAAELSRTQPPNIPGAYT